ncbi:MAG: helix-turn-helix transcriptional regulator [Clostridia bacterium]|nr:helix-turn-helix transcriptional regulator [Clostridia bacterium]
MFFYQRLKDLREDHDKSQSEIASLLGMKQQQYARYENGTQEIPFHHVITLARYYNVSIDYLSELISVPEKLDRIKD